MNSLWYRLPFYLTLVSGKEWTGYPLECFNARIGALKNYQIYGNSVQSGLPQGYTLLEYISNGVNREPFINTNITSNGNDVYEIDFSLNQIASDTRCVFGGRIGATSKGRALWLSPNTFYPQYGNYQYNYRPIQNITPVTDQRYQYKSSGSLSEINIYGDSQKYYSDYGSAETYEGGQIVIFGIANVATRDARTAYMKVYSFRITRDDTVIMNLVPCINPNNEIGMYDTVSKTFFGNAGTGNFIAGPIVQPETPVMPITPQYPSLIESVGDKTKNLFDYEDFFANYQMYDGSSVGRFPIKLKPNTEYTVSTNVIRAVSSAAVFVVSGNNISWTPATIGNGVLPTDSRTVTTDNEGWLCVGAFYNNPGFKCSIEFFRDGTSWIQIEEGGVATGYEAYGYKIPVNVNGEITNIYLSEPLRKIGDVADYIDFTNQKVVRWFKEETIKPSTEWGITSTGVWLNNTYFDATVGGFDSGMICSHFKLGLAVSIPTAVQDLTFARDSRANYTRRLYIRYNALGFTTGEQVTQWLSENKPTIVYQLATPIEESIELPEIRLPGACVITTDTKIKPSNMYGKQ